MAVTLSKLTILFILIPHMPQNSLFWARKSKKTTWQTKRKDRPSRVNYVATYFFGFQESLKTSKGSNFIYSYHSLHIDWYLICGKTPSFEQDTTKCPLKNNTKSWAQRRFKRLLKAQNNGFLVLYPRLYSFLIEACFLLQQLDHFCSKIVFPINPRNNGVKFNYQTPQAICMFFHRMLRTQVVVRLLKLPVVQHGGIFMGVMQSWIQWDQILVT